METAEEKKQSKNWECYIIPMILSTSSEKTAKAKTLINWKDNETFSLGYQTVISITLSYDSRWARSFQQGREHANTKIP